jgi:hypothetical protein
MQRFESLKDIVACMAISNSSTRRDSIIRRQPPFRIISTPVTFRPAAKPRVSSVRRDLIHTEAHQ